MSTLQRVDLVLTAGYLLLRLSKLHEGNEAGILQGTFRRSWWGLLRAVSLLSKRHSMRIIHVKMRSAYLGARAVVIALAVRLIATGIFG